MNELRRAAANLCRGIKTTRRPVHPVVNMDPTSRAFYLWRTYRNDILLKHLGIGFVRDMPIKSPARRRHD